jgi:hypothetical protein
VGCAEPPGERFAMLERRMTTSPEETQITIDRGSHMASWV